MDSFSVKTLISVVFRGLCDGFALSPFSSAIHRKNVSFSFTAT